MCDCHTCCILLTARPVYNYFMWNKVAKNIKNSSIKNINFFINACVRKCSFPIKFFDGTSSKPFVYFSVVPDLM